MRVGFDIEPKAAQIIALLGVLVSLDIIYLRQRPATPSIYRAGVRYQREPRDPSGRRYEQWRQIPEIMKARAGDCEDLACWRCAEAREREHSRAVPWLQRQGNTFHVVVRYPDGSIEDPSKLLGMGKEG